MAYVEENKVYNTVYGKLKNNNKMKQIQRVEQTQQYIPVVIHYQVYTSSATYP